MELNFNDIRTKDIISVSDGRILGRAIDIVFDQVSASVKGFSVPLIKKGFSFKKPEDIFISIKDVIKIGKDVILVEIKRENTIKSQVECQNLVPKIFKRLLK